MYHSTFKKENVKWEEKYIDLGEHIYIYAYAKMDNSSGRLFFVSNVPVETTEEELKCFFSPSVKLIDCKLTKTEYGIKRCHGYIRANCSEKMLQHFVKDKLFKNWKLEIDSVNEEIENEIKRGTTNITRKKKKNKDGDEGNKQRNEKKNIYEKYENDISESISVYNEDIVSTKNVNIINENGRITKYGLRILNNMNMYDVILLVEKIQTLIRSCPQTAIKLLTENKAVFYSLVHALFLLGILNIEINPLEFNELKTASFLKIKNRFQYLCLYEGEAERKVESEIPVHSNEGESFQEQRKNKRSFIASEENAEEAKKKRFPYKQEKKQKENIEEMITPVGVYSFANSKQEKEIYTTYMDHVTDKMKTSNSDAVINNCNITMNLGDTYMNRNMNTFEINYNSTNNNNADTSIKANNTTNKGNYDINITATNNNAEDITYKNYDNVINTATNEEIINYNEDISHYEHAAINNNRNTVYNIKDWTGNMTVGKTRRSRNVIYGSNPTAACSANYNKCLYSFSTNSINVGNKYKKQEHKKLYKENEAYHADNEYLSRKKNNPSRIYSNKNYTSRDYAVEKYRADTSSNYDANSYKNGKPLDYAGGGNALPKHVIEDIVDPFAKTNETDKNFLPTPQIKTNLYGNIYLGETGGKSSMGGRTARTKTKTATGGNVRGTEFLKVTNIRTADTTKFSSGLYKKSMKKIINNSNKSISRVSMHHDSPTFYNTSSSNKKSKTGNHVFKNINMSMDNVHEMGSKVMYRGKYKEFYGGKYKNKTTNKINNSNNNINNNNNNNNMSFYTNNNGTSSFANEQSSSNVKTSCTTFYKTEDKNLGVVCKNELYANDESGYIRVDPDGYDKGEIYRGNRTVTRENSITINKNTNFGSVADFNKTEANNNRSAFPSRENEYVTNYYNFDVPPQMYTQNNTGNYPNDNTKNVYFNNEAREKENDYQDAYNIMENDNIHTNENTSTLEVAVNEVQSGIKETFFQNKVPPNITYVEEENKQKTKAEMHHTTQGIKSGEHISATEHNETYYKKEENKEHENDDAAPMQSAFSRPGMTAKKHLASKREAVTKHDSDLKRSGSTREVSREQVGTGSNHGQSASFSVKKHGQNVKRTQEESHGNHRKQVENKSKTSGKSRCIKLIDRKHSTGGNNGGVVKVKSIEVIEKKNPLIKKKKEQPLINSHLKIILNKLKIALGSIPSAPDDLVNEVIGENNMLNNIIKSKYEDMLKWPNEQILRVLSIRKALKQRGYPITDII